MTNAAAVGAYSNSWGGHQPRIVRTSDGTLYTEFVVPAPGEPDAREIHIAKLGGEGWEVIDTIPIAGTPGHLLVGPDDRLHLVVWAGSDGEQGQVELWSTEPGGQQFSREVVPGEWHPGDPLYGGAGISPGGDIYVVASFGGSEPGGHFEWTARDVTTGQWNEFSIVELDFRYAYPYVLPGVDGTFTVVAGRDVTWEALGYERPCPDCQYAFDAVAAWRYSAQSPRDTFTRVDVHEEKPTLGFPEPAAYSNYNGDAYEDSRGRLHIAYAVQGTSTGGERLVRHAVIENGQVVLDAKLPGEPGAAGAFIEDAKGRLFLLTYFMDTPPEHAELVIFSAEDELGSKWGEPTRLSLDGHVVRYSGITLAAPRSGTGLADFVDGVYPSGAGDGPEWVHFRVQLGE